MFQINTMITRLVMSCNRTQVDVVHADLSILPGTDPAGLLKYSIRVSLILLARVVSWSAPQHV